MRSLVRAKTLPYRPAFSFPQLIFISPILKRKENDSTTESQSHGSCSYSLTLIKDNNWSKHLPGSDPTLPLAEATFQNDPKITDEAALTNFLHEVVGFLSQPLTDYRKTTSNKLGVIIGM